MSEIATLAERLGVALRRSGLRLATAESCTGGWIAEAVTAVPGSSAWFDRGVVAYVRSRLEERRVRSEAVGQERDRDRNPGRSEHGCLPTCGGQPGTVKRA